MGAFSLQLFWGWARHAILEAALVPHPGTYTVSSFVWLPWDERTQCLGFGMVRFSKVCMKLYKLIVYLKAITQAFQWHPLVHEVSAITQGVIGNLVTFSSDIYPPGGISFCIKPVYLATFLAVTSGHPCDIYELIFFPKTQESNSSLLSQMRRNDTCWYRTSAPSTSIAPCCIHKQMPTSDYATQSNVISVSS